MNAIFIDLMLAGERPRIFGSGEQLRDYLYVDDVVDANVLALDRGNGVTMNLGTGVGTSVNQIYRMLQTALGFRDDPIYVPARPGEVQRNYLDASRARQVLGWEPRVPLAEGLRRTIEWFRSRG